jgi:hypothetical protein
MAVNKAIYVVGLIFLPLVVLLLIIDLVLALILFPITLCVIYYAFRSQKIDLLHGLFSEPVPMSPFRSSRIDRVLSADKVRSLSGLPSAW